MTRSKKILWLLLLTACMLLIEACTATQRLNGLQRHHPELFGDSSIPVVTPQVTNDTKLGNFSKQRDTVTIVKDNLIQKYFYNNNTDSIFIHGECRSDTVFVKVPTIIDTREEKEGKHWYDYLLTLLPWIVILIVILRR